MHAAFIIIKGMTKLGQLRVSQSQNCCARSSHSPAKIRESKERQNARIQCECSARHCSGMQPVCRIIGAIASIRPHRHSSVSIRSVLVLFIIIVVVAVPAFLLNCLGPDACSVTDCCNLINWNIIWFSPFPHFVCMKVHIFQNEVVFAFMLERNEWSK